MRIAISGSHATGKSSLVAELSHRVADFATIEEPYYLLEADGYVFDTPPTTDDFVALLERAVALLGERREAPVLFDRSPADYLAYIAAKHVKARSDLRDLTTAVASALETLDLVVFVSVERADRIAGAELPRLRRRVDRFLREMLIEGAWGFDVPVLEVHGTVAERTAQVIARIGSGTPE